MQQPDNNPANDKRDTPPSSPAEPLLVSRPKTKGEWWFDLLTYGGFGLVANEFLSTSIVRSVEPTKSFAKFRQFWMDIPYLNRVDYVGKGRIATILLMCLGGMLVVFPIKFLENAKSDIVRQLDRWFHGENADSDPAIAQAHAEMDKAPRQSWQSLGEGRVLTVTSGIALDFLAGHPDAASTKLLENTRFKHFSSLERACVTAVRAIVDQFDPAGSAKRLLARSAEKPYVIQPGEGRAVGWLATGGFLLMFSTTLTLLFYWSSKAFATHRALRQEKKEEITDPAIHDGVVYTADIGPTASLPAAHFNAVQAMPPPLAADQPTSRVSSVAHHEAPMQQPNRQVNA